MVKASRFSLDLLRTGFKGTTGEGLLEGDLCSKPDVPRMLRYLREYARIIWRSRTLRKIVQHFITTTKLETESWLRYLLPVSSVGFRMDMYLVCQTQGDLRLRNRRKLERVVCKQYAHHALFICIRQHETIENSSHTSHTYTPYKLVVISNDPPLRSLHDTGQPTNRQPTMPSDLAERYSSRHLIPQTTDLTLHPPKAYFFKPTP
jgi:hypothetical protein